MSLLWITKLQSVSLNTALSLWKFAFLKLGTFSMLLFGSLLVNFKSEEKHWKL